MTEQSLGELVNIIKANIGDARLRRANIARQLSVLDGDLKEIAAYLNRLVCGMGVKE